MCIVVFGITEDLLGIGNLQERGRLNWEIYPKFGVTADLLRLR